MINMTPRIRGVAPQRLAIGLRLAGAICVDLLRELQRLQPLHNTLVTLMSHLVTSRLLQRQKHATPLGKGSGCNLVSLSKVCFNCLMHHDVQARGGTE